MSQSLPRNAVLKPLNEPRRLYVRTDAQGRPLSIGHGKYARPVAGIRDHWRVDEGWWRPAQQLTRLYYECEMQDGDVITVCHERKGEGTLAVTTWFRQQYYVPAPPPPPAAKQEQRAPEPPPVPVEQLAPRHRVKRRRRKR